MFVFLYDDNADTEYWKTCQPESTVFEIDISEDRPERLDLRFCFRLRVSIGCRSKKRAEAFFEACKAYKPLVLSSHYWKTSRDNLYLLWSDNVSKRVEDKHELLT